MGPLTNITLEIACFSVESAIQAARNGADRIEFCASYESGGLTPSYNDLKEVRKLVGLTPINVMIRVRPGTDFTCSTWEELASLKRDMIKLKPLASGFVFGLLDGEGGIDFEMNSKLVQCAYPKPCTFHRAFDHANGELYEKLEIVRRCGFTSILTSGLPDEPALHGVHNLDRLISMAEPFDINIIVGGGVRASNLEELIDKTGAVAYHSAAMAHGPECDVEEIQQMREIINGQPD